MSIIFKEDHYIGVFYSAVSRYTPEGFVLFESMTKNKNHIRFTINPDFSFNVYVKTTRGLTNTDKSVSGKLKNQMNCSVAADTYCPRIDGVSWHWPDGMPGQIGEIPPW